MHGPRSPAARRQALCSFPLFFASAPPRSCAATPPGISPPAAPPPVGFGFFHWVWLRRPAISRLISPPVVLFSPFCVPAPRAARRSPPQVPRHTPAPPPHPGSAPPMYGQSVLVVLQVSGRNCHALVAAHAADHVPSVNATVLSVFRAVDVHPNTPPTHQCIPPFDAHSSSATDQSVSLFPTGSSVNTAMATDQCLPLCTGPVRQQRGAKLRVVHALRFQRSLAMW